MTITKNISFILITLIVSACSTTPSRPQLYPNQAFKDRGSEVSQKDIDECLKESDSYLKTPEGEKLRKSANSSSIGTSVGFGFGTMGSSVGLGIGSGHRNRLSGEEQVRRNFTNQCLLNKGYQVVGWED